VLLEEQQQNEYYSQEDHDQNGPHFDFEREAISAQIDYVTPHAKYLYGQ